MPRPSEPEARRARAARPWVAWLVAAVAAAVAAVAAPDAWPVGEATLHVTVDGALVATAPVQLIEAGAGGDPSPTAPDGARLRVPVTLALDQALEVRLVDPGLGTVAVAVELPDGRFEPVPVLDADDDGTAVARRQPLRRSSALAGLLALVVVLWISEAIPVWATALVVPCWLVVTDVLATTPALAPFAHPVVLLFLAGFLLAEAMRRVGLDRAIAARLVAATGRSPVHLLGGFLGTAAVLSMAMSNTAAVAVLLPVALAVTEPFDDDRYRRVVVLGTAYAATIGGVGSAIGTPANQIAIAFLDDTAGRTITFLGWFALGLPMVVLFVPVIGAWLWWRLRPAVDPDQFAAARARATATANRSDLGRDARVVMAVLALVVVGWTTEPLHGVHVGIVALLGALALVVTRHVRTEDLRNISWASLLTFGGGLALGSALTDAGMADWGATRLAGLADVDAALGVAVVAATALVVTTVASNTASAAMLVPLAIPLATVLDVDVVLLVVVVAIATSVDFALVVGTPPTMLAHSTGLYTTRDLLRLGGALDVAALLLLVTVVPRTWELLGVVD